MRVYIDGIIFGRQIVGGISRTWEELLKRFPSEEMEVELLVPFKKKNTSLQRLLADRRNWKIHQDVFYWPSRYFERVEVRDWILRNIYLPAHVDIFHSTYFTTTTLPRVKRVLTINDMIPELYQNEWRNKWTQFGIDAKRKALESTDAIVTISESAKQDLLTVYPWAEEKIIRVIHLAHSKPKTLESYREVAKRHKLFGMRSQYFLYVGAREQYKNFEIIITLLKTCSHLRRYRFLCVGPPLDEPLRKKLEFEDLTEYFFFLDTVKDSDLNVLYRNAVALIFPSLHEGFGLPVLEAMSNNCPVVCSTGSSLEEVGGDAAIYFDPLSVSSLNDALLKVINGDKAHIVERGQLNILRFDWDNTVKQLISLYKSIL